MADYKELYLTMVRATEQAIDILIEAQRKCEDLYIDSPDAEIRLLERGLDKDPSRE